jgi:hypothetical protein
MPTTGFDPSEQRLNAGIKNQVQPLTGGAGNMRYPVSCSLDKV